MTAGSLCFSMRRHQVVESETIVLRPSQSEVAFANGLHLTHYIWIGRDRLLEDVVSRSVWDDRWRLFAGVLGVRPRPHLGPPSVALEPDQAPFRIDADQSQNIACLCEIRRRIDSTEGSWSQQLPQRKWIELFLVLHLLHYRIHDRTRRRNTWIALSFG